MNHNLLILGDGPYNMLAKETAEEMGCFERIECLDDAGEPAIGRRPDYGPYAADYTYAFVAVGDGARRLALIRWLEEACFQIAALISPSASVSPSAQLMKGTLVAPGAVIRSNATLCIGVFACGGCIVDHDAFVGDACLLGCGSVAAAAAILPAGTRLDYNEVCHGVDGEAWRRRPPDHYTFEDGM